MAALVRSPPGGESRAQIANLSVLKARLGLLGLQRDRVDVAAVVRLLAVHGAAIAVAARVGIGVDAEIIDHEHAGILQPQADEAGEVEHRMSLALARQEEAPMFGIRIEETLDEFGTDFVGVLADQRTDGGDDA